jgi:excisionase family DNA binding protein
MKAILQSSNQRTMNTCDPNAPLGRQAPDGPILIKKKDLAKRLSVSPSTIDGWVQRREIPFFQVTARLYLYELEAVMEALKNLYQIEPAKRG